MDRNIHKKKKKQTKKTGLKQLDACRNGQKRTAMDRNGQKLTEADRNGRKQTATVRNIQKLQKQTETHQVTNTDFIF